MISRSARYRPILFEHGGDILASREMQFEHIFMQHGTTSCYTHSVNVACMSLWLAERLRIRVDRRSMVRGALLHDFFMYDWHDPGNLRLLHGFTHAKEALSNARKQFELNEVECDVIQKHMFPLNIALPKYWETVLVSAADKISAVLETVHSAKALRILKMCRGVGL